MMVIARFKQCALDRFLIIGANTPVWDIGMLAWRKNYTDQDLRMAADYVVNVTGMSVHAMSEMTEPQKIDLFAEIPLKDAAVYCAKYRLGLIAINSEYQLSI